MSVLSTHTLSHVVNNDNTAGFKAWPRVTLASWVVLCCRKVKLRFFSPPGYLLWQRLEPHSGPAGHGQSSPAGSDQAGHCVSPHLSGYHRGEDPAAGQGEKRGLKHKHSFIQSTEYDNMTSRGNSFNLRVLKSFYPSKPINKQHK